VNGTKSERDTVVFVAFTKSPQHTAYEEAYKNNAPEPDHSQYRGWLNIMLLDSERLQHIPKWLPSQETHGAAQRKVTGDYSGQCAET
jgi:hypothetical protein